MIRLLCFKLIKEQIHRVFEAFIVLSCLTGIDHVDQHREILFLFRGFIPDKADVRCI